MIWPTRPLVASPSPRPLNRPQQLPAAICPSCGARLRTHRQEGRGASPPPANSAGARASGGSKGGGATPRQPLPGTREVWPQRVGWLPCAKTAGLADLERRVDLVERSVPRGEGRSRNRPYPHLKRDTEGNWDRAAGYKPSRTCWQLARLDRGAIALRASFGPHSQSARAWREMPNGPDLDEAGLRVSMFLRCFFLENLTETCGLFIGLETDD